MKESKVSLSPGRRSPGGRSFHSRGPAAEKLLSPSLLCVRGTSSFRISLELDRSGRRPTSDVAGCMTSLAVAPDNRQRLRTSDYGTSRHWQLVTATTTDRVTAGMRMVGLGVLLAVYVQLVLIAVKHQLLGVPFSWLTFTGAICFIAAVANYINQPTIT